MSKPLNRILALLAVCVGVGVITGITWAVAAERPGYYVGENLGASIPERGLASVFSADAWFTLLVGLMGLLVGILTWLWARRFGWWVCIFAILGAGLMAVVTWQAGMLVSPGDFEDRLAAAQPGDIVAIDLELRARAALLVAPFAAITPVMIFSAWWPEDREPEDDVAADDHAMAEDR